MNSFPRQKRALTVEQMESRDMPSVSGFSPVPYLPPGTPASNQFIVTLRPGVDAEQFATELRGQGREVLQVYSHALNGLAYRGAPLGDDPRVALVEPDQRAHILGKPGSGSGTTPPAESVPLGVKRIGGGGPVGADLSKVNIAIIDSGIDATHPDLNVQGGANFTSAKSWNDDNGHGTHVAGTAAAKDNDIGVVGVAPGAPLWAVKVLDRQGSGWLSDIIKGVDWVTWTRSDKLPGSTEPNTANDIAVANMSLGGISHNVTYHTAIQNSVAKGVVYVVAAGNDGRNIYGTDGIPYSDSNVMAGADDSTPASFDEVIAVSALADSNGSTGGGGPDTSYGADDTLATFSNWGGPVYDANGNKIARGVEIAAPGVDIYSTYKGGGYTKMSGTSMASPHVAGAVALYIAKHGRANDYDGVKAIRAAVVNAVQPMADWRTDTAATDSDKDAFHEGLVWIRDMAVRSITVAKPTQSNPSYGVTVSVENQSAMAVSTFTITLYANGVLVGTQTVSNLGRGQSLPVQFDWSPVAGNYTLLALVSVPFDIDSTDDSLSLPYTV